MTSSVDGFFGQFGGKYVAEVLYVCVGEMGKGKRIKMPRKWPERMRWFGCISRII